MITMPDAPIGRARAFWIAVVASLLVHLIAIAFVRAPAHLARKYRDEIVRISPAIRFEKRARAARPAPSSLRRELAKVETASGAPDRTTKAGTQNDSKRTLPHETSVAPAHDRLQMEGKSGSLRHGQGTYSPTKSWHADGLDYYYVTYEYVYPNGTYESGRVPWPIHFPPARDPFANDRLDLRARTPLPAPPSDYVPPGTLGKALRVYFPKLRFSDAN